MNGNEGEQELGGLSIPSPRSAEGAEGEQPLDTVSGFEQEARKDHERLKHPGAWETCPEETCVDARELLAGR